VASTSKVFSMGHDMTWVPAANIPSPLKWKFEITISLTLQWVHKQTGNFLSAVFTKTAFHTFRTSDPSDQWTVTHSIWSRDYRPATRRLFGCILHSERAKFEQNRSRHSRVMCWTFPKFGPAPLPNLSLCYPRPCHRFRIWSDTDSSTVLHLYASMTNLASLIYHQSHCIDSFCCNLVFCKEPVFTKIRGYLGATYTVHLWLVRKRVVDFLLVLIELFSPAVTVTVEALWADIGQNCNVRKGVGNRHSRVMRVDVPKIWAFAPPQLFVMLPKTSPCHWFRIWSDTNSIVNANFERKFQGKEGSSTNNFWRQEIGVPGLSYGVVLRLAVLIQYRCVTDTDTTTAIITAIIRRSNPWPQGTS